MMVLVHMIALKTPIENSKTVNLPNLEPPTIASGWDLRGFTHRKLECFRAFCGTSRHPEPSWNTIQPTTTTKKNMLMASPHKASSHGSIGSTRQLVFSEFLRLEQLSFRLGKSCLRIIKSGISMSANPPKIHGTKKQMFVAKKKCRKSERWKGWSFRGEFV